MTQPLSHTAQAVLDAADKAYWCPGIEAPANANVIAAAAIRALTEAKLPDTPHPDHPDPTLFAARIDLGRWIERQHLRACFLSVAYELEKRE